MSIFRDWKKEPIGSTVKDRFSFVFICIGLVTLILPVLAGEAFRWSSVVAAILIVALAIGIGLLIQLLKKKARK